jgi:HK97 family phage major capsid protein
VAGHLAEGEAEQGGYLVPTEFLATLLKRVNESSELVARARPIPMQTNQIQIPAMAGTSRADGYRFGGLTVYWTPEAGAKTASKPTFRLITLTLNKLVGFVYASDELIADSPISIAAILNDVFPEELGFVLEQSFVDGTGAGQPLGFMNAACLVTVAAEAAQPANTIVFQNIVNMWSRMHGPSRKNAIWIINQDAEPQLYNMGLAVGTGGGPAYLPSGGLSVSPYATLMGRPVVPCEHCQTLGTTGDIALIDMNQYLYGRKSTGIEYASSMHLRFNYDEMAFRWVLRADGQPWWDAALTPKHGTNTQSPFVVLATRP